MDESQMEKENEKQLELEMETGEELVQGMELPGNSRIVDDPNPGTIEADIDLTSDLPSDIDEINLTHLKIRSLMDLDLGRFTLLKLLCLRDNLIDTIAPLKFIQNKEELEELDLYDNRFNHISKHVNEFINLKSLDLSFNKLKHIKNLDQLVNLENLYLIENKIEQIENLETMVNLTNLELGGNLIKEIPDISYLGNLQQLWLGKNRLTKISGLDNLPNLRILSLQANRITKLEGLDKLTNLEELYVSSNGITEIEGLDNCKNLQILDIGYNKITTLKNLEHLDQLTDLWCSYNGISDFNNVEKQLSGLPDLECVYFEHNPLQEQNETSYRRKLKLVLPQLKKIDATYCT